MNNENSTPKPSEEVDLGQLFKLIGNAINNFFSFFRSIFKGIFSVIVYSLKAIIVNFKIIAITMFIALVLGIVLERLQPQIFKSQMLVKPYFNSKYQLINNIDYYNSLIKEEDFGQLKKLFDIDIESAKQLVKFKVEAGPESKNTLIYEYNQFLMSLDSSTVVYITYDEYVKNRSIYSSDIFNISVISKKRDVFKSLESGLNKTFANFYSSKKMQQRDSLITLDKNRITKSLDQIDSLRSVYIEVLKSESNSQAKGLGVVTLKEGMSLVQERVKTKEYELLETELKLRDELNQLESQKVEEDVFFDTISSFQDIGAEYKPLSSRYSIVFPLLSFFLLIIGYLFYKAVIFAKNYEG